MKCLPMAVAAILFVVASAVAQNDESDNRIRPSCGPGDIKFEVQTSKHQPDTTVEPGKAQACVVEVLKTVLLYPRNPALRIGLDGSWIGAIRNKSYLIFPIDPGEHHLCAQRQSIQERVSREAAFASFTAEAGKRYYFRALFTGRNLSLNLERVSPDEGQVLVSSSALSISHPKK